MSSSSLLVSEAPEVPVPEARAWCERDRSVMVNHGSSHKHLYVDYAHAFNLGAAAALTSESPVLGNLCENAETMDYGTTVDFGRANSQDGGCAGCRGGAWQNQRSLGSGAAVLVPASTCPGAAESRSRSHEAAGQCAARDRTNPGILTV